MNQQQPRLSTPEDTWMVTAVTLSGQRYRFHMETERDADALALILHAHGRDIATTEVTPA
ncbi:MAG: hypothetical protein NC212_08685 [Staphylococcus sp.]|nr:hypothetical protein [Staphylococcus sp.]